MSHLLIGLQLEQRVSQTGKGMAICVDTVGHNNKLRRGIGLWGAPFCFFCAQPIAKTKRTNRYKHTSLPNTIRATNHGNHNHNHNQFLHSNSFHLHGFWFKIGAIISCVCLSVCLFLGLQSRGLSRQLGSKARALVNQHALGAISPESIPRNEKRATKLVGLICSKIGALKMLQFRAVQIHG